MQHEPIVEERRRTQRQRVFKGAHILGRGLSVPCIVRNLSPNGAGLEITGNALLVPDDPTLVISTGKVVRRAHLRWRNAKRIGVEFD